MKKLFSLILALAMILAAVPASALTVSQFVKLYNKAVGNGELLYPDTTYMLDASGIWFLDADARCQLAVFYTPAEGADPLNYQVNSVCIVYDANSSDAVFLNTICTSAAALYPDVPENERMSNIMRAMVEGVRNRSYGHGEWDKSVPFITENMGVFAYQETEGKRTFLFMGY